jgi:4-hydroxybenzoate polyprenyltransferase
MKIETRESLKAYLDLTRAHFSFCWPLLFCSGLLLAFKNYGGFSWSLIIRAALIGLCGLEAGMVQNDYVDREMDKKDVDSDKLTRYWRPFRKRPIPSGLISPRSALGLFLLLVILCLILVATLPYPNFLYLVFIMPLSYSMQYFYQVKKKSQHFPLAQLLGRMDVSLFPVAGYLCYGHPDKTVLRLLLFFYPWIMAHLGVNDLVDVDNDEARGMKTVTVLYGLTGTARWILFFTIVHILLTPLLLIELGGIARVGFIIGFLLLGVANYVIVRQPSPAAGLKAISLFHLTMAIYVSSIILDYAV